MIRIGLSRSGVERVRGKLEERLTGLGQIREEGVESCLCGPAQTAGKICQIGGRGNVSKRGGMARVGAGRPCGRQRGFEGAAPPPLRREEPLSTPGKGQSV